MLDSSIFEFCHLADMVDVALPVGGGALDQTKSFTHALKFLRAEEARWKLIAAKKK